jgi:hypothetical protein
MSPDAPEKQSKYSAFAILEIFQSRRLGQLNQVSVKVGFGSCPLPTSTSQLPTRSVQTCGVKFEAT